MISRGGKFCLSSNNLYFRSYLNLHKVFYVPFTGGLLVLATLLGVIAQAQELSNSSSEPAEGQLLNYSSDVVIPETLRLEPGSLVAFSFRTCSHGELLRQKGDGIDELKLLLDEDGRLVLHLASANNAPETAVVEVSLLDARWHTVILSVDPETKFLTVNVSDTVKIGGSANLRGPAVLSLNLTSTSPQLHVGEGTRACIREGPGIHLSKRVKQRSNSATVQWLTEGQTCLLPTQCSGKISKSRSYILLCI